MAAGLTGERGFQRDDLFLDAAAAGQDDQSRQGFGVDFVAQFVKKLNVGHNKNSCG